MCLARHGNDAVDIRTRLSDQSFSLLLAQAHPILAHLDDTIVLLCRIYISYIFLEVVYLSLI